MRLRTVIIRVEAIGFDDMIILIILIIRNLLFN